MECVGHPLDEFAILAAAICTGKHVGIMLNVMEFWTSREDSDWEKCDIYFAYIRDVYTNREIGYVIIEQSCTAGVLR